MADFDKMIRDIPSDLVRETDQQESRDHLAQHPEKIPYAAASYLATHLINEMGPAIEKCREDFAKDLGFDPGRFTVAQVIGALNIAYSAVTRYEVESCPRQDLMAQKLLIEMMIYDQLVDSIIDQMRASRK